MKIQTCLLFSLCLFSALSAPNLDLFKDVVIEKVDRLVNAQTQLLNIDTTVTFKNERDVLLKEVYLALPNSLKSFLKAFTVTQDGDDQKFSIVDNLAIQKEYDATLYKITLETPLKSQQSTTFSVSEVYWKRMDPLPKKITLQEDQKVVLTDNVYYFSPYSVLSQSTSYKLAGTPISYSDEDGKVRGAHIDYKFPTAISGFTVRNTKIHFENNTPFVVFKKVQKTIDVSHWGNIYIEESYQLANEGAEFKGEYSRVDYNAQFNTGRSALKGLSAKYPVHAWGMHYRDEVGNISTSKAYRHSDHVALQITPRFSIFGGWSANWVISYNLPTKNYLSQDKEDPSSFHLMQTFGFPFPGILAEEYEMKLIFPEGAHDISFKLPFAIDEQFDEKTFSYLDFNGRPTKVIRKKGVIEQQNVEFQTNYKFETSNLYNKGFVLFGIFLALFIVLIILGRVDMFGSSKPKKE